MRPDKEIDVVREWIGPFLKEGMECPCCYKMCRIYDRKLNSGMALLMTRLYQQPPSAWIYVRRWPTKLEHPIAQLEVVNGDFSYLLHWGLLEQKPQDGGKWRLTHLGRQFVEGTVTVPHKISLLNNKCIDKSDEHTDIKKALGDRFDYDELMAM